MAKNTLAKFTSGLLIVGGILTGLTVADVNIVGNIAAKSYSWITPVFSGLVGLSAFHVAYMKWFK